MLLRDWKSPQGLQEPSCFATMWRGDAHSKLLLLQALALVISQKYSFAAASLVGSRHLYVVQMGPSVGSMLWTNPCFGLPVGIPVHSMSLKSFLMQSKMASTLAMHCELEARLGKGTKNCGCTRRVTGSATTKLLVDGHHAEWSC